MSQQNYSKLENGKLPISDEVLSKIASILRVDKETLESFDTSMVFNNNNQQGGQYNAGTNIINNVSEEMLSQLNAMQKALQELTNIVKKLSR